MVALSAGHHSLHPKERFNLFILHKVCFTLWVTLRNPVNGRRLLSSNGKARTPRKSRVSSSSHPSLPAEEIRKSGEWTLFWLAGVVCPAVPYIFSFECFPLGGGGGVWVALMRRKVNSAVTVAVAAQAAAVLGCCLRCPFAAGRRQFA